MKALRKVLLSLLIVMILASIAGVVFIKYLSRKGLPDYNKDAQLSGLTAPVKVIRDKYAIPHIYAENEKDLYRAVGYTMAQDRLWQMDLLRRLTQGRLSEIFGKDLVNADQLFRSLQFSRKSELVLEKTDTVILDCLSSFADGVNQYIEENKNKLPLEFSILGYKPEPWKPVHSANLIGYMSWDLSSTLPWTTEAAIYKIGQVVDSEHVKELIPDMEMQKMYVHPEISNAAKEELISTMDYIDKIISDLGLHIFRGSNNWAVSGKKSSTGKPLLANDMHLGLNAPGIWYQMHHVVHGNLNVTGVVLPGQPFVICGHNNKIAWGMTNVMLDDIDFYIETLNPQDTSKYKIDGKWIPLKLKKELIITKEGDTVTRINRYTRRGPVISGFKKISDKVISMRWIGMEFSNEIASVYKFNRAGNWDEFRNAARTFISIGQNIVYADTAGNIGLQTAAGIPIRKGNHILFAPGDTSEFDWVGIVPFEKLPFTYNPDCGYVASANNRTVGDNYPYYISCWFDLPNRYERIVQGLTAKMVLNIDDFKAIQSNQNSRLAETFVPVFLKTLEPAKPEMNEIQKSALQNLEEWKYDMPINSIASSVFEQTFQELSRAIFKDELGDKLYATLIEQDLLPTYLIDGLSVKDTSVWCDDITTKNRKETFSDNIKTAFLSAVDTLTLKLGKDVKTWEWGKLHTLTLKHPLGKVKILNKVFNLNRGPYPVGGSFHTVSPYAFPWSTAFKADFGSSHRHIYSVGDWDNSLTIIPTGNSGIPASKNYCDQTELYLNYNYHPDPFSNEEVEKLGVSKMIMKPKVIGESLKRIKTDKNPR